MEKSIDAYLRQRFGEYMQNEHSDFQKARVSLYGYDVYQKKRDRDHIAWVGFGGQKSSDSTIVVALLWTCTGKKCKELELWKQRNHPAIPDDGYLELPAKEAVGDDLYNNMGDFMIDLDIPKSLQEKAFAIYRQTDEYKVIWDMFLKKTKREEPAISEERLKELENRQASMFFPLWEQIARFVELDQATIERITKNPLDDIYYILSKYGIPFLNERIR